MSTVIKRATILCLVALAVGVPLLYAQWVEDGVPVTTAFLMQYRFDMAADGTGGSIIAWEDYRNMNFDIYTQRIDKLGNAVWTSDGIAVELADGDQTDPRVASDGAGGAIIAWDHNDDIYAQRIDASGTVQWAPGGVVVSTALYGRFYPDILPDGAGGAIVTWSDIRNGGLINPDVYAQRIDASGNALWRTNGVPVCSLTTFQISPLIVTDDAGGAIIMWQDESIPPAPDLYAQRIDGSGNIQWGMNGALVCSTAVYHEMDPCIVADGSNGAVVAWWDTLSGDTLVYAQRIDGSGGMLWPLSGVAVCAAGGGQVKPRITRLGTGVSVITWMDKRNGNYDIFAQKLNGSGVQQWAPGGVAVCIDAAEQYDPSITSDGANAVYIAWKDDRGGIYAQRIDTDGNAAWDADGIPVCTAAGAKNNPQCVFDGIGGVNIVWEDDRNGGFPHTDIYTQRIDESGHWGYLPPHISAVSDVPADEGGWVRIEIVASSLDNEGITGDPATGYTVWRLIEPAALRGAAALNGTAATPHGTAVLHCTADAPNVPSGVDIDRLLALMTDPKRSKGLRLSREQAAALGLPPGEWESLGFTGAMQEPYYYLTVPTKTDSTGAGTPWEAFIVTVHTPTPSVYFVSDPDSGYSVDNLAPGQPLYLTGAAVYGPPGIKLNWEPNTEGDLSRYAVYRGESENFEPGPENCIGTPQDTTHTDTYGEWPHSYYKVAAVDRHGNESPHALLRPEDVSGGEEPVLPRAAFLAQNVPNPFNPRTTITFGIAVEAHVSLRIFDAAGRLVTVLVDERREASRYEEVWDGTDGSGRSVASGVYFYSLTAGDFKETRKMVLLR